MRFELFMIDYFKKEYFFISFFNITNNLNYECRSLFHIHYIGGFLFEICLFYKIIYIKDLS